MPTSPYYRVRNKGLSNAPQINTTVRIIDTWHPEDGETTLFKEAEPESFWAVADSDAGVIFDNVDFNGSNASGDYTMAQAVDHYKCSSSSLSSVTGIYSQIGQYIMYTDFGVNGPFPGGHGEMFNDYWCPGPPTADVNEFAIQALEEMASMFPPGFDALSFILELKSLTSTMDTLFDIASAIRELRHRRGISVRHAARIHAGYNFGVSPILDDVGALWSTFRNVKERIEWLMRNKQKWVRVGSRRSFHIDEDIGSGAFGGFGYAGWSPGMFIRRTQRDYQLNSTARAKFEMPDVSPWLLFTRGVISECGFDRPLSTVWEVTPFSWLVDYFVPVSDYLKTVQHYYDPFWSVRDPNWSFKASYSYDCPIVTEWGEVANLGRFTLSRYCRKVGLPPWEWTLTSPSTKQLGLLAAVAIPED